MNSLKTLCVVIVLSAIAYGVYVTLTGNPPAEAPPPEIARSWDTGPQVQFPAPGTATPAAPAKGPGAASDPGAAPKFIPGTVASPPPAAASGPPRNPAPPAVALPKQPAPAPGVAVSVPPIAPPAAAPPKPASVPAAATPPATTAAPPAVATTPSAAAAPGNNPEFAASFAAIVVMLDQGRSADAHLELSKWYDDPRLSQMEQQQVGELLDRLAGTVIYSRQHLLEPPYEVQAGDSLEKIAQKYQVPWELLAKINGISDPNAVQPGEQLKVIRGPFSAIIRLSQFRLTLVVNGRYAGWFPVGVGRDQSTPEGEFAVRGKQPNPVYYGPDQMIGADDPNNPLGERWIDLGNRLGIHGTIDPASIGREESRGCIRLTPRDVEDVYDILSVGSQVRIVR